MISLSQIQCLVATVDEGSVTAAAAALGVTPQAVSKAVHDLERSLGHRLFVRKASGLKPTLYGLAFSKRARQMLQEAQRWEGHSAGEGARDCLSLWLCIPKTANFPTLSRRIASFLTSRTGVPARVGYGTLDECVEAVAFGAADAFVTMGKTALAELDVSVIDSVDVGVLVAKDHPLAPLDLITLADAAPWPLYLTPDFPFFNDTVLESLKRAPEAGDLRLSQLTLSLHGAFNALVSSRGCIVMPSIQGVDDWMPATRTVPFDAASVPRVPLCLVTPQEGKTALGATIEELLVRNRSARRSLSRLIKGRSEG